jgi:hypothetical protein
MSSGRISVGLASSPVEFYLDRPDDLVRRRDYKPFLQRHSLRLVGNFEDALIEAK